MMSHQISDHLRRCLRSSILSVVSTTLPVPSLRRLASGPISDDMRKNKKIPIILLVMIFLSPQGFCQELPNEVVKIQSPEVAVRVHPKTGRPYVVITHQEAVGLQNPLGSFTKAVKRPDYRMLEKNVKPKEVGYEGPSSDRKKVYVFAASIAAAGLASGTAVLAAPAAATTAANGSGAAVFAGAGTAVAAGTVAVTADALRVKPQDGNYTRESVSQELRDFLKTSD